MYLLKNRSFTISICISLFVKLPKVRGKRSALVCCCNVGHLLCFVSRLPPSGYGLHYPAGQPILHCVTNNYIYSTLLANRFYSVLLPTNTYINSHQTALIRVFPRILCSKRQLISRLLLIIH